MDNFEPYKCLYMIKDKKTGNLVPGICHCNNTPWSCKNYDDLKASLKQELKLDFDNKCAFCQRSMSDDENISIDIEHILPKEKYVNYSFDKRNLVISCRRCNTGAQKGTKTEFIINPIQNSIYNESIDFSVDNYRFIYPKLEPVYDFYRLISIQIGVEVFRRYKILKYHQKLRYTFKFFNLKKLEIGSLDSCFGIPRVAINKIKIERYEQFPLQI